MSKMELDHKSIENKLFENSCFNKLPYADRQVLREVAHTLVGMSPSSSRDEVSAEILNNPEQFLMNPARKQLVAAARNKLVVASVQADVNKCETDVANCFDQAADQLIKSATSNLK